MNSIEKQGNTPSDPMPSVDPHHPTDENTTNPGEVAGPIVKEDIGDDDTTGAVACWQQIIDIARDTRLAGEDMTLRLGGSRVVRFAGKDLDGEPSVTFTTQD